MMARPKSFLGWQKDRLAGLMHIPRDVYIRACPTHRLRIPHIGRDYLDKRLSHLLSVLWIVDADIRYTMPIMADAILQSGWGRHDR